MCDSLPGDQEQLSCEPFCSLACPGGQVSHDATEATGPLGKSGLEIAHRILLIDFSKPHSPAFLLVSCHGRINSYKYIF